MAPRPDDAVAQTVPRLVLLVAHRVTLLVVELAGTGASSRRARTGWRRGAAGSPTVTTPATAYAMRFSRRRATRRGVQPEGRERAPGAVAQVEADGEHGDRVGRTSHQTLKPLTTRW